MLFRSPYTPGAEGKPEEIEVMTNLEKFLDQNYITTMFCLWYKNACSSDPRSGAWGLASIRALCLLEIDAADDLAFVLHMIAEHREIQNDQNYPEENTPNE